MAADICTWRGIITKIMLAPYESNERFHLRAQYHADGRIYIDEKLTPEKVAAEAQDDARGKRFQYWGSSFESFCTNTRTAETNRVVVRPDEQFCSIVKTVGALL